MLSDDLEPSERPLESSIVVEQPTHRRVRTTEQKAREAARARQRYVKGGKPLRDKINARLRKRSREKKRPQKTAAQKRAEHAAYMREWYGKKPGYNSANVQRWREKRKLQGLKRKPEQRTSRSSSVFKEYREAILNALADRDGWRCWVCHETVSLETCSPDHVVSPLEGGAHTLANLKIACKRCNTLRGLEVRKRRHGY